MAERYPSQLSGGQQQRVALARALVFEPQLVLMDEPLGALDKQLREHMQIELKELHRQLGVTFVYVTHDQGEALTMSDRVAVFNDGVIQQIDAADRMYETPANRFVAGFIGDSTVLHGTVRAARRRQRALRHRADRRPRDSTGVNVNGAAGRRAGRGLHPARAHRRCTARRPHERSNVLQAQRHAASIYFGDHLRLLCRSATARPTATVKLPLSVPAAAAARRRRLARAAARADPRSTRLTCRAELSPSTTGESHHEQEHPRRRHSPPASRCRRWRSSRSPS